MKKGKHEGNWSIRYRLMIEEWLMWICSGLGVAAGLGYMFICERAYWRDIMSMRKGPSAVLISYGVLGGAAGYGVFVFLRWIWDRIGRR